MLQVLEMGGEKPGFAPALPKGCIKCQDCGFNLCAWQGGEITVKLDLDAAGRKGAGDSAAQKIKSHHCAQAFCGAAPV